MCVCALRVLAGYSIKHKRRTLFMGSYMCWCCFFSGVCSRAKCWILPLTENTEQIQVWITDDLFPRALNAEMRTLIIISILKSSWESGWEGESERGREWHIHAPQMTAKTMEKSIEKTNNMLWISFPTILCWIGSGSMHKTTQANDMPFVYLLALFVCKMSVFTHDCFSQTDYN